MNEGTAGGGGGEGGNIKAKTIRVLGFRKLTFSMEWWFNSFSVTLYMTMG